MLTSRTHFPRIAGCTALVVTLISVDSPSLAGFLCDATVNYFIPFSIAFAFVVTGIILVLLLRLSGFPKVDHRPLGHD